MKTPLKLFIFPLIFLGFMALSEISLSQAPPPPPSGAKGSGSNKAPGGGAPINGGLVISLAMVAGFGAWKLFKSVQKIKNQT